MRDDPERDALVAAAVDSLSRRRDQANAALVDDTRGFQNERDESHRTGGPRARRSLLTELATDSEGSDEGSGTDVDDDDEEDFGMSSPPRRGPRRCRRSRIRSHSRGPPTSRHFALRTTR